jgi:cysteinyl-tRNA synthetase
MSAAHLGDSFDIHGGGLDLIFPHHENEIAQSTCAHGGKPFVRYWMHNGYLTVNGEKMSKSLGNFFTVRDLLVKAPGEAIRFYMLGTHYRQPLDWTLDGLAEAKRGLDRLYGALRGACEVRAADGETPEGVRAALEDDLNTPLAIARMHELATALNKAVPDDERARLKGQLVAGGALLGLLGEEVETWFKWVPEGSDAPDDEAVDALVAKWDALRRDKNFAEADRLRDELLECHVSVSATPSGPSWRRVN